MVPRHEWTTHSKYWAMQHFSAFNGDHRVRDPMQLTISCASHQYFAICIRYRNLFVLLRSKISSFNCTLHVLRAWIPNFLNRAARQSAMTSIRLPLLQPVCSNLCILVSNSSPSQVLAQYKYTKAFHWLYSSIIYSHCQSHGFGSTFNEFRNPLAQFLHISSKLQGVSMHISLILKDTARVWNMNILFYEAPTSKYILHCSRPKCLYRFPLNAVQDHESLVAEKLKQYYIYYGLHRAISWTLGESPVWEPLTRLDN